MLELSTGHKEMIPNEVGDERVIGLDPTREGFGFVIFDGPNEIIDWGLSHILPPRQKQCLAFLENLLDQYEPDRIALEDTRAQICRRRGRTRRLLASVLRLARNRKVKVTRVSRSAVRQVFGHFGAVTKYQIALVIADQYKELAARVPPPRQVWMTEDRRMGLFGAASFALTYFATRSHIS